MNFQYLPNKTIVKSAIITHKLKGESWKGYIIGSGTIIGVYFVENLTDTFAEWYAFNCITVEYIN